MIIVIFGVLFIHPKQKFSMTIKIWDKNNYVFVHNISYTFICLYCLLYLIIITLFFIFVKFLKQIMINKDVTYLNILQPCAVYQNYYLLYLIDRITPIHNKDREFSRQIFKPTLSFLH